MRVFKSFIRVVRATILAWCFLNFCEVFMRMMQHRLAHGQLYRNTSRVMGDTWWNKERLKQQLPVNDTVQRLMVIPANVTQIEVPLCESGMKRIEEARPY